jgi:hypothetical protein
MELHARGSSAEALDSPESSSSDAPSSLSRSGSEASVDTGGGGHHRRPLSASGTYSQEAKVMYAFQSTEETEMSVEEGDHVRMLEEAGDDGWAFAELLSRGGVAYGGGTGREVRGYIPFAYVQLIAPAPASKASEGAVGDGGSGADVIDATKAQMRKTHYSRERVRQIVEWLPLRVAIVALVVLDLVVLGVELILSIPGVVEHEDTMFSISIIADIFTLIVTIFVGVEVGARIFVHQKFFFCPASSFSVWVNYIDLFVAALSALIVPISITFTFLIHATEGQSGNEGGAVATILRLLLVLRLVRLLRIVVFACTQRVALTKATRRLVSQNRRRFRDPEFDLDLTYVTDQLVAMSLPARGQSAAIRNPIGEVARFFKKRHTGHYHILNLTAESYGSYAASAFEEHVTRLPVDDHNAVPLLQLYDACCAFEHFFNDPKVRALDRAAPGGGTHTRDDVVSALLCLLFTFTRRASLTRLRLTPSAHARSRSTHRMSLPRTARGARGGRGCTFAASCFTSASSRAPQRPSNTSRNGARI